MNMLRMPTAMRMQVASTPNSAGSYHPRMRLRHAAIAIGKWGGLIVALLPAVGWWYSGRLWVVHVGPVDWTDFAVSGLVGARYESGSIAMTEQATGVPVPRKLRIIGIPTKTPGSMARRFGGTWVPGRISVALPFWFLLAIAASLIAAA